MPEPPNGIFRLASRGYSLLARVGNSFGLLLLLFFRLNWGWQFFIGGKGKLLEHASVTDFFVTLHLPYPGPTAWFVGGVECIGGILLILGLAARPVGLVLAVNMLVAYLSVADDRAKLFGVFKDQDAFLQADPFFFLLTGLLAFAFGAGPWSADAVIGKWLKKKENIRHQINQLGGEQS